MNKGKEFVDKAIVDSWHRLVKLVSKIDTIVEDTYIYKSSDTKIAIIKAILQEYENEIE